MTEWAPLVAFLGGVIGVTMSFYFQRQLSTRAQEAARLERLRQDRLTAYSDLAGHAMDYRRLQIGYRIAKQQGRAAGDDSFRSSALATETRIARARLWHDIYRVRLLGSDQSLLEAAGEIERLTSRLDEEKDDGDAARLGDDIRAAVERFVDLAQPQVAAATGVR